MRGRSREPILRPEAPYELEGFFGKVVFTCGALTDGDLVRVYYGAADGTSPATRELVETEARRILDQGHDQALETLRANRHRLDALVEALLRTETLDAADAYRAAGVPYPAEPDLPTQAPDVVRS